MPATLLNSQPARTRRANMVQLKSFKYTQEEAPEEPPNGSDAPPEASRSGPQEAEPKGESVGRVSSSSSSRSSSSSNSSSMGTIVGGGILTSVSTSSEKMDEESAGGQEGRQSQTTLASGEECQSAVHELSDDEEEEEAEVPVVVVDKQQVSKSGATLEQGKLEDIAKERAAAMKASGRQQQTSAQEASLTRILIEKGSATNLGPSEQSASNQQQPITIQLQHQQQQQASPHLQRLKFLPRSHTSPSALSQLANSPASIMRGGAIGQLTTDSGSQLSIGTQRNSSNHFEIRWQNVRLFAKQNQRLPKISLGPLWYGLWSRRGHKHDSWSTGETPEEAPEGGKIFHFHSPPVQRHNIPPTISEQKELAPSQTTPRLARPGSVQAKQSPASRPFQKSDDSVPVVESLAEAAEAMGDNATGEKCILNNISGQVFSGQITAILGPSGVGKTTLLNSLTGRNTLDGTGRVALIGAQSRKRMSVVTVPQNDILPGKLTTLEDLIFTSRLKNPQGKVDHMRNIDRVVKHLQMEKFLHTKIDRLSGGEQRRLSIARELLASPDILILDEPTSGLDANTCKKIIMALKDIVEHSDHILDKPMSIIVTIHQPQQEVYNLFHRVYVMAVGGRVIYEGPPQLLLPTLIEESSLSKVTQIEELNENPAIVAIEVASGEFGPEIIEQLATHHEDQVYEEFSGMGYLNSYGQQFDNNDFYNNQSHTYSPSQTPRSLRGSRKSPLVDNLHRKRLNSFGNDSIGRPTPIMAKRQFSINQMDRISNVTSASYASSYDNELPEVTSKLKVDKRLRRSVVMKSNLFSHTWTLMQRCWLLNLRDLFLMAIRILGYVLVAAGTVQIFSSALDPNEHLCPKFETEVEDIVDFIGSTKERLTGLGPMLRQSNSTHLFFFHILLCITMVTSALTGLVFPLQMRMFIREYKNGWYSPSSFILSQTLAELPVDIIGPLITMLITYPLCNQPASVYYWREIAYSLVVVLCSIICKSQAQIVGAFLMDSIENSVFISCVCVTGPALLSGIPLRIHEMILPLQIISYGSFLRYGFESLMILRYGYGMCPCDPELVNGYPTTTSERAVPPQLNTFAKGIIDLDTSVNQSAVSDNVPTGVTVAPIDSSHDNIILKYIQLVTEASNLMVHNADELGDCNKYRSLHLLSVGIPNDIFPKWIGIMVFMFVVSRILTYFVVKTVIKLRRR